MAANHYNSEHIKPLIIAMMKKEGFDISESHIKIWETDRMHMKDVERGCNYVRNTLGDKIIVYTNDVPNIEFLERNEGFMIFDKSRLQLMALRTHDYELYDILS